MSKTAKKTDPKLWDKVKKEITAGDKGGKPGQWSARKAQMASQEYKKRGGEFEGGKSDDNSLHRWTEEDWGTKSGNKSGETGERYLPKGKREKLSDTDYAKTSAKKRADTEKGKQFSSQPDDVRDKVWGDGGEPSKEDLLGLARRLGIAGRSKMTKGDLLRAVKAAKQD